VRIAVGSDEATELVTALVRHLEAHGHEVTSPVPLGDPWPEVGRAVAEAVASGAADRGVVCCWTGTGVSIAANKVRGARAALCADAETAQGARRWNDANVLALSLRSTDDVAGIAILDAFLATEPDDGELEAIARLE